MRADELAQFRQLNLYQSEAGACSANGNGHTAFSDPAFAKNKTLPIHRWVPWIAGFSSDFVSDTLAIYLKKGLSATVLDPFAGVGTTLVESILKGYNAIGFEINPYAALACRTKVNIAGVRVSDFSREIQNFRSFYKDKASSNYTPTHAPPIGFRTRSDFYSPAVLRKVLIVADFIDDVSDLMLKDLFKLAFSSTMVRYSNYSYEPSLGRRVSAGKEEIQDYQVESAVLAKLEEMRADVEWYKYTIGQNGTCEVNARVINDSFFNFDKHLDQNSIDLLVTSPPYLNNYHYNRNTRPQLYWLGFVSNPKDLEVYEHQNFGKFWQTVRELEYLDLDPSISSIHIREAISSLRLLNSEKGVYGGNGWANYAASYFNDCVKFAKGITYALKQGATALVVIGNSIIQGHMIPTDQFFAQIAQSVGLELVEIHIPRATRVGNSIINSDVRVGKAKKSHALYEAVVELRRL